MFKRPDLLAATCDFVAAWTDVPAQNVFQGYQNRAFLPEDSNTFVIVSLLDSERVGTNVKELASDGDNLTESTSFLQKVPVQIDCYGPKSSDAATLLSMLGRDPIGVGFFSDRNIALLFAEDVRNLTGVDQSQQYVPRHSVTFWLSNWSTFEIDVDYFTDVFLNTENIDVHHKE